jgi:hypothetical protein
MCASQTGWEWESFTCIIFTHDLDLQSSHFKVTMMHSSETILREESSFNPMTRLWLKIIANHILNHKLLKFMKLVETSVLQVFGLVEDFQHHELHEK